jgi:hypothetical protein
MKVRCIKQYKKCFKNSVYDVDPRGYIYINTLEQYPYKDISEHFEVVNYYYVLKGGYRNNLYLIEKLCKNNAYRDFGTAIKGGQSIYNIEYIENSHDKRYFKKVLIDNTDVKDNEKLKIGKWYRHKNNCTVFKDTSSTGYGTDFVGNWSNSVSISIPENWRLATDEEIEEVLIKEAKKRGYKEGNFYDRWGVTKGSSNVEGYCCYYRDSFTSLTFNLGYVFCEGKWAEIVEEPEYLTKDDLVEGEVYYRMFCIGKPNEYGYVFIHNKPHHIRLEKGNYKYENYIYRQPDKNIKPATKQQKEHLEQCIAAKKYVEYKEKIEKWSVGTWVVFTVKQRGYKVGDIDHIRLFDNEKYFHLDKEKVYHNSNYANTLEWFTTKKEAEEFAATLKESKKIEKWSVGTWVVFVKRLGDFKARDILKIVSPLSPYNCTDVEEYGRLDIKRESKGEIKWFATEEEAGEFAATLKEPEHEYKVGDWIIIQSVSGKDIKSGLRQLTENFDGKYARYKESHASHFRKATKEEIESVTKESKKNERIDIIGFSGQSNSIGLSEPIYQSDTTTITIDGCNYPEKQENKIKLIEIPKRF